MSTIVENVYSIPASQFLDQFVENVYSIPASQFLDQFVCNPLNHIRNAADYQIKISSKKGEIEFETGSNEITDLLYSLLIIDHDFTSVQFKINNALTVTPADKNDVHTILAGNSRTMLMQSLYDQVSTIEKLEYQINFSSVPYQIKADFQPSDLLAFQLIDNTGIQPTASQKAKIIWDHEQNLINAGVSQKLLTSTIMRDLRVGAMDVSHARYYMSKVSDFFKEKLQNKEIENYQALILLAKIMDDVRLVKFHDLTPMDLWSRLLNVVERAKTLIGKDARTDFPTIAHVKKLKQQLVEEAKTSGDQEIDELDSTEGDGEGDTGSQTAEKTLKQSLTQTAEKTLKQSLIEMEADQLRLEIDTRLQAIINATSRVNSELYDSDELIRIALLIDAIPGKIQALRTADQKALEKAQKISQKKVNAATELLDSLPGVSEPTEESEDEIVVSEPTEESEDEIVVSEPTEESEDEIVVSEPTEESEDEIVVSESYDPATEE
jgi:hypothetical protein